MKARVVDPHMPPLTRSLAAPAGGSPRSERTAPCPMCAHGRVSVEIVGELSQTVERCNSCGHARPAQPADVDAPTIGQRLQIFDRTYTALVNDGVNPKIAAQRAKVAAQSAGVPRPKVGTQGMMSDETRAKRAANKAAR